MNIPIYWQAGSDRITLIKGSTIMKVPVQRTPAFNLYEFAATGTPGLLIANWTTNLANGTIKYLMTSSPGGKVRADLVDYVDVQVGNTHATKTGLAANTTFTLLWYYEDIKGVTTPTTGYYTFGTTATTPNALLPPTAISPVSVPLLESQPINQNVANFIADQSGCSFTKILDTSNVFTVTTSGGLSLSASVLAINSPYSLTVRATNSSGSFDQIISVPVTAPPSSSLVADATFTTQAGALAILDSWIADPVGTTPPGKTPYQQRVLQLTVPLTSLTIASRNAPMPVVIRSIGPYTDGTVYPFKCGTGCDITNTVSMTGCTNITMYGFVASAFVSTGNTGCYWSRNAVQANILAGVAPTVLGALTNGTNNAYLDNLIVGFKTQCFGLTGSATSGIRFENNVLDVCSEDLMKASGIGTATNITVRRNWFGRTIIIAAGAHCDLFQSHQGTWSNVDWWGNVAMLGTISGGNDNISGAMFLSNTNYSDGWSVKENIYSINCQNAIQFATGTNGTARNNTIFYRNTGPIGSPQYGLSAQIQGAWSDVDYNIVAAKNTTNPTNPGPNGQLMVTGSVENGSIPNFASYAPWFDGVPTDTNYIDQIKPKVGAATHWAFAGPQLGASSRSQEIWVGKVVPGSVGWPVAGYWHRTHDPLNTIGTNWTGMYDADGNNV
jgi:hypothetical protein